jgi:hypothetical protein
MDRAAPNSQFDYEDHSGQQRTRRQTRRTKGIRVTSRDTVEPHTNQQRK